MKIYFRILSFAQNINSRLVKFFVFALLGVVFQAVYLGFLQPVFDILFKQKENVQDPRKSFSMLPSGIRNWFHENFAEIVRAQGELNALAFVCVLIIITVFLCNLFRYFERLTASKIKVDIVKNLRMVMYRNILRLHIGFFNDQRRGDLISRFTNDISEVEGSVVNGLKSVFKEPITLIVFIGMLFSISVELTLFTLVVLPITGGIIGEIIRRLKKKAKLSQESMGRITNMLDETFGGMRVIKAFTAATFMHNKMERETSFHRKVNYSMSKKNEAAAPLSELLGVCVVAVILYYGGQLVMNGLMEASQFIVFLAIYANMIQPAKSFANGITSIQKGTISAERIFKVMDLQTDIVSKPGAIHKNDFEHHLTFDNVSFAYDKDSVLKNINLEIRKGTTVALVGPSGGGKSTLADLVPRFYDPTSGAVKIDGHSLTDLDVESLRKLMGIVTQESILFNDTIFNNIAFGVDNPKEEDVIRAAKIANAHDFIMQTEEGYQTLIGERGSKLSGGQRQRISIARAVLKNPPILILDEATSALDSESERLVQDALFSLMKNRTSIVIAHRLSTIQHADEIVVIQNGEIVERGKHDSLLLRNGLYRKLNEIQRA
jgi:ATP-binding cassette, subfamily B, bacterial MsbA